MTTTTLPVVAGPGVYDIPADLYHLDPVPGGSLSSTGARKLLPPSCPALYRHEQDNPKPYSADFAVGSATHAILLGGAEVVVVDAEDWRTKAAREARDQAHAAGDIPLLPAEFDQAQAMVAAVRSHHRAGSLFSDLGLPEQTLIWQDPETGVSCRARLDWLSDRVVDLKTTVSAEPGYIARHVAEYGYHQQADFYLGGAVELDVVPPDAEFLFVFVEKTPPYLVTVVELDDDYLRIGHERNQLARQIYRDCTKAGVWPGYATDIELIAPPVWVQRRHDEGLMP
jgi:hypothetical protein